ncbi:unnamed protein product [Phaeothamnion confervicola]
MPLSEYASGLGLPRCVLGARCPGRAVPADIMATEHHRAGPQIRRARVADICGQPRRLLLLQRSNCVRGVQPCTHRHDRGWRRPRNGPAERARSAATVFGFAPSSLSGVVMNPGHNFPFGQDYFRGMSPVPAEFGSGEERNGSNKRAAVPPCCRTPLAGSAAAAAGGADGQQHYPHPDGVKICKALQRPENQNFCTIDVGKFLGDLADARFRGVAVVVTPNWDGSPGDAAASVLAGGRDCIGNSVSGGKPNGAFPFQVGCLDLNVVAGGRLCGTPTCSEDANWHQCIWWEGRQLNGHPFDVSRIVLRMLFGRDGGDG